MVARTFRAWHRQRKGNRGAPRISSGGNSDEEVIDAEVVGGRPGSRPGKTCTLELFRGIFRALLNELRATARGQPPGTPDRLLRALSVRLTVFLCASRQSSKEAPVIWPKCQRRAYI